MLLRDKSKKAIIPLLIFSLLLMGSLGLMVKPAQAQGVTAQITDLKITTIDGREVSEPLISGVAYNVRFTIEVGVGILEKGVLTTDMALSGDRYWTLDGEYPGIDTSTWQPGQETLIFDLEQGTANLILTGLVPEETTTIPVGPISDETSGTATQTSGTATQTSVEMLHRAGSIRLMEFSLESGQSLDVRTAEVIDNSIETYRDTLASRQALVAEIESVPEYIALVNGIIAQSQSIAGVGYTDRAIAMLQTIPESGWAAPVIEPEEPEESSSMLFIIVITVLGVIAIIAIILFLRSKADASFVKQRADDEARKLDIMSARISKIGEKSLASDITQIKESLESISGR
ncbi:MAG: hypothetical protein SVM79_03340 [Chloroflexota bacterium]|nr:hypothetical protein [Chloroflexota bacterium]